MPTSNTRALDRRTFLQLAIASGVAATVSGSGGPALGDHHATGQVQYRTLGRTGLKVSLLGYGSNRVGNPNTSQDDLDRMFHQAFDNGLNNIDTAPCYPDSEARIGMSIKGKRDDLVLITKVGHTSDFSRRDNERIDSAEHAMGLVDQSLQRLGTDYLDVVLIHSLPLDMLRQGRSLEGLKRAQEQGKVRFIGYSGDSEAGRHAVESNDYDVLMTTINCVDQQNIDLLMPGAIENNMGVMLKRPLANAIFRYADRQQGGRRTYWDRREALDFEFFKDPQRSATGPDGAAGTMLRFAAMVPGVHTLSVGTMSRGRWASNNKILNAGPLSDELYQRIRDRWHEVAQPDWIGQT
ncbi:MAG: aldo/keto reductase [Planctomycetota bacterium]|jgi:aryl-alcohol dehydrogenase-like predicted oxidoreductase